MVASKADKLPVSNRGSRRSGGADRKHFSQGGQQAVGGGIGRKWPFLLPPCEQTPVAVNWIKAPDSSCNQEPFKPGHVKAQFRVINVMSYGCTLPC